jgi:hypothetical protein
MRTMRMRMPTGRGLATLLLLMLLAACASGPRLLRTEVSSFNEWPADVEKSFSFVFPLGIVDSPVQRNLQALVAEELSRQGFTALPAGSVAGSAHLAVSVRARVTPKLRYVAEPILYDPFWRGRWDSMWVPPSWYGGFAGYREYPVTVFERALTLNIDDVRSAAPGRTARRIYEGSVTSVGASPAIEVLAPYLVRALFVDFPGMNGQVRTIDVPVEAP